MMASTASDAPRRTANATRKTGGRPRADTDGQIMEAALELLGQIGFDRMTMGDVAERSGVSKPSVYRRWSNKAELVLDAIAYSHRNRKPPSGHLRDDLIEEMEDVRLTHKQAAIGMLGSLLAVERDHPELLEAWRDSVSRPRRNRIKAMFERAKASGEVNPDLDVDLATAVLVGAYYGAYTAADPIDEKWVHSLVEMILDAVTSGHDTPT